LFYFPQANGAKHLPLETLKRKESQTFLVGQWGKRERQRIPEEQ